MSRSIKVLMLEDQSSDMELLIHALKKNGYNPDYICVEDQENFLKNLSADLDLVLADYTLPSFDAPSALRILQQSGFETPFIVVTGSVSEEAAVECMKLGAADYLIKGKLTRLGLAVDHALQSRDLQKAKRMAYAALRENQTYLSAVVNTVDDGIFTFNDKGTILSTNPAFERVFGASALECQGQNIRHFMPGAWPEGDFNNEPEIVAWLNKSRLSPQVKQGVHKQKRFFPLELTLNKMQTESFRHFVGIVRDVTEKRNLEEQIRQAQKMEAIGRLAGGIAHDFNNLLTAIVGSGEMLLQQPELPESCHKKVQEIIQVGERAGLLTRQLLAFSRKQVVQPVVLELNNAVNGLLDILHRIIGDTIKIHVHSFVEVALTLLDPGQMEQVILNLAINARDAMPKGGIIHFEISLTGNPEIEFTSSANKLHFPKPYSESENKNSNSDYVCLRVRDTGTGIDEAILPHIFEPFYTTKEMGEGTGLGLSTVYGIVQQNKGFIQVQSELKKGTHFSIYFPHYTLPLTKNSPVKSSQLANY